MTQDERPPGVKGILSWLFSIAASLGCAVMLARTLTATP